MYEEDKSEGKKKKEQIDPKPKLELCSFVTMLIRQSSSAPRSSTQLGSFTPQIPFIWNRVFEFYNSINPMSYFVSLQNLNFLFLVLCSTSLLICALLYLNLQHTSIHMGLLYVQCECPTQFSIQFSLAEMAENFLLRPLTKPNYTCKQYFIPMISVRFGQTQFISYFNCPFQSKILYFF